MSPWAPSGLQVASWPMFAITFMRCGFARSPSFVPSW
jgi:hypothetical protein